MTPSIKLSRRGIIGSATAAAAAVPILQACALSSADASPSPTTPLRALHRFNLGAMRITVIDDARFTLPAPPAGRRNRKLSQSVRPTSGFRQPSHAGHLDRAR